MEKLHRLHFNPRGSLRQARKLTEDFQSHPGSLLLGACSSSNTTTSQHGPTERSQATATQLPTYAPRRCCQSPALRSAGAPGQSCSLSTRGASVAGRPGVSDHLKAACTRHSLGAGSCGTLETPNLPEPAWCFGLRYRASHCRVKDTRWEAIPPASNTKPIPTPNASNVE